MNYCEIKKCDVANGTGVRVTLFVSGCTNHCKGCFQPETWDFNYGKPFTSEVAEYIYQLLDASYISGLTVLGGEPFEPANQKELLPFLQEVKQRYPEKNIWMFSGFRLADELLCPTAYPYVEDVTDKMLGLIDVLVEGRFEEDKKDITLVFRGSSNQRIVDLKKMREDPSGKIHYWSA